MRIPVLSTRLNQSFADGAGALSLRGMVSEKRTVADNELAWGVGLGAKYDISAKNHT